MQKAKQQPTPTHTHTHIHTHTHTQASMFGEFDDVKGVTENILLGQIAQVGTGVVELLLDEEKLKDAQEMPELMGGYGGDMMMMGEEGMMREGGQTPGMQTPGMATPYNNFGFGYGAGAGGASPGAMLTPGIHLGGATPGLTASPLGASPFISPMVSPGRATPGYDAMASPYVGSGGASTSPYVMSASPVYSGTPGGVSSASPAQQGLYSPSSPAYAASPYSSGESVSSPCYSPTSE